MQIDLNSDLGESFGPWTMGDDATMLSLVNSANIACGGHASDPETMFKTLSLAKQHGVMVGATGPFGNVLKVRPPLCFNRDDAAVFLTALAEVCAPLAR